MQFLRRNSYWKRRVHAQRERERVRWVQYLAANAKGFTLLELVIVCAIVMILVSMSVPSAVAVRRFTQARDAKTQVTTVAQAVAASNLCAARNQSCPGVAPLIPLAGTAQIGAYTFTFTGNTNWFSYAAYNANDMTAMAFYTDSTGLLRCSFGGANSTTAVCP